MSADAVLRAEVIVIGSGAGGGPAAALLAEAGRQVVVLEAGPRFAARDFGEDEAAAMRQLGKTAATASGAQNLYAGACVGGSTVINDALCWPTPPEVLEAWRREHGLSGLSQAAFAPWVERAWADVHAEATPRSHINRNAHRLEQGAQRLGWAAGPMHRNVRGCANLGRCNLGCPIDAKQSTLVTYVPRAERAGARVIPGVRALRVRSEAGAVTGVDAVRRDPRTRQPRGSLRLEAPVVVLAAGVLESGALLQRSGLGGGRAGLGLQLHSSAYVSARFPEPVHGYYGPTMAYGVSEFSDVNGHEGPGFMLENVSVMPMLTASALPGFGAEHARAMQALPFLAQTVVVLRDRSRGRVQAVADGGCEFHYDLEAADLARLRDGLVQVARAYLAAGALEAFVPINGYGPVRSEADLAPLRELALDPSRLSLLYAVHLFGGAIMGGTRAASVCDPSGRCWEARGLYVADAAALPSNTGVNPQVTIMANALRVAAGIAAEAFA